MTSIHKNERGFSAVEGVLVVVIIAAIGFVGWYVYKHKATTTTPASTVSSVAPTTSTNTNAVATPLTNGTDNSSLQTDLQNVGSSSNQTNQDMTTVNSSLNDQSTFTSVPQ